MNNGGQYSPTEPGPGGQDLIDEFDSLQEYAGRRAGPRERSLAYFAGSVRSQFSFDGNTRTARLMMTGELLSNGYDAVAVPYARRLEFNIALDTLFEKAEGTPLMSFLASCAMD